MELNKEVNVVMLDESVEQGKSTSNIFKGQTTGLTYIAPSAVSGEWAERYKPQHLYFTSDEEIKKNDWVYQYETSEIYKVSKVLTKDHLYLDTNGEKQYNNYDPWVAKKIIATTDNLHIGEQNPLYTKEDLENNHTLKYTKLVPKPSQQFIEAYVREYNKGNVIERVMIEMHNNYDINYYTPAGGIECAEQIDNWQLKINSHNEITTRPIKDSWTRKEVEDLLNEYRKHQKISDDYSITHLTNWIKENM